MNINKIKKDFIWYSIGTAIPMIISFIKTPIFTRYYSPVEYGNFALINTIYSYINLLAFSWLLSCVWRYYIHKKNNHDLNKFYSNIIALFFIGFFVTTIFTIIWITLNKDIIVKKIIIANYINLIFSSITEFYFIILRLEGKSFLYNLFNVIISILSFVLLLILTFIFKNSIDAMINCSNIINSLFLIYIIYKFIKSYSINRNYFSKEMIKNLIIYGFSTIFINASLLILTSGDRYVINYYCSKEKVGIYSQIYGLAQISILAFSNIIKNIITPYEFKLFEEDINNENEFLNYIILYVVCILPLVVYFSIYSKQIANLLLGEKFRSGYKMMPYIMISCLLYGISDMHQDRIKFKNKLKIVCINVTASGVLNLLLNFLFIPIYGYEIAAITTLFSYIFLYFLNIYFDITNKKAFFNQIKKKSKFLLPIIIILNLQASIHIFLYINYKYCSSIFYSLIEGTIFLLVYFFYTYFKIKNIIQNKEQSNNDIYI